MDTKGQCECCGRVGSDMVKTDHAGILCRDVKACVRLEYDLREADRWYAEEVLRMAERAPA